MTASYSLSGHSRSRPESQYSLKPCLASYSKILSRAIARPNIAHALSSRSTSSSTSLMSSQYSIDSSKASSASIHPLHTSRSCLSSRHEYSGTLLAQHLARPSDVLACARHSSSTRSEISSDETSGSILSRASSFNFPSSSLLPPRMASINFPKNPIVLKY